MERLTHLVSNTPFLFPLKISELKAIFYVRTGFWASITKAVAFAESRSRKIAAMTEMTKIFNENFGEFSGKPYCKELFIDYRLEGIF